MKFPLAAFALLPLQVSAQPPRPAASLSQVTNPTIVHKVAPDYTPEARAAGLQGTVSLYVEVGADGEPSNIEVLHGLGLGLDAKAVEAVRRWEFRPGARGSEPAKIGRSVDVDFRLDDSAPWRIRLAAYHVDRNSKKRSEVLAKPILQHYSSPDAAACPAPGADVIVDLAVGADGAPGKIGVKPLEFAGRDAIVKAVEGWRFQPATADGKARAARGQVEFECGEPLPPVPRDIYRVGNGVTPPVPVYSPEPQYTEEARRARVQGEVTLSLIIDRGGHSQDIVVAKPLGLGLDQEAVENVKQWRFTPGMKDGRPVAVQAAISVNFRLL